MNNASGSQPATDAAQSSEVLLLQHCNECDTVQYPSREICKNCLGDALSWEPADNRGVVLATSDLHHSLITDWQSQLPWPLASVQLDCGVRVLAHNRARAGAGARVAIVAGQDPRGETLLAATALNNGVSV
ncbi:hypothetical protein FKG94_12550 [Exilibacterium tricleocarpae]|uniref:Uncharacterized protein n=1 Tax=Exilibacterium tricleocarpae TaxID=2591008 RepID=A0A545TNP6_9GAMM|nr:zinc ribbon domain-containing protein [Exilibacterium tricleocarpae]TQV78843.1 hypothetical protein FKG94_12550 [Exilibacterium tricleocarpae]